MGRGNRIRVVLLALTGFGNPVLEALLMDTRVQMEAVFSVKYNNPFPYYEEEQLPVLCARRSIPCYCDVKLRSDEGLTLLRKHDPDLVFVATFNQILSPKVLEVPPLGVVNFHPSLLPLYRGPCPTNAALLHDEAVTGVTAHYVVEELDAGNILLQRSVSLDNVSNDGHLRHRLAYLTAEMIPEVVSMFTSFVRPTGVTQNHDQATLAPRPKAEDGYLELAPDLETMRRRVRAFNPLPGTSILCQDQRVAVDRFALCEDSRPDGIYQHDDALTVVRGGQAIRLFKKI